MYEIIYQTKENDENWKLWEKQSKEAYSKLNELMGWN
jgi:hypothetical protein